MDTRALIVTGLCIAAAPARGGDLAADPRVRQATTFLAMWLEGQAAYEQIPGVSAAVVHDQQLVWASAFGHADPSRKAPATTSTVYSICSISKLFTSVALMQLRDEGRLRLDDPVEKHLPWFKIKQMYPESGPITVESLLTHSAGFQEDPSFPFWTGAFDFPSREQVIAKLPSEETLYPAQRRYEYSNLGLLLAGEIVAAVTGTPTMPFSWASSQRLRDLPGDRNCFVDRKRAALQSLGKVLSLDQLHREEVDCGPVVERRGLEAVELGDGRMVERSEKPGLAVEADQSLGVGDKGPGQQLERDLAPKPRVGGAVHLAHATGTDRVGDPVVGEGLADQGRSPPGL